MRTIIACVGGFLGAGKTTALQAAAAEIRRRGKTVVVITNDQGSKLVDTEVMRRNGIASAEITGGCFCCKFDDLVMTMVGIIERQRPDIILAEAVGSCTDLSATVYQPLRKFHSGVFALAPLSVFVEPNRIRSMRPTAAENFPDTVHYLFKKQLAEADLIVMNKLDTINTHERIQVAKWLQETAGDVPGYAMSARHNTGVAEWVDQLVASDLAGSRILDIDYDIYAAAEASLGWLNATVELEAAHMFSLQDFTEASIRAVQQDAAAAGMAIAHLKAMATSGATSDRIALTDDRARPEWSGNGQFEPAQRASLVINARLRADPDELVQLIQRALDTNAAAFGLKVSISHIECFSPSRPTPRHRLAEIAV
jgi:G3E family GTPase